MSKEMFSKMCDSCGTNPAILFFRTYNGKEIGEEGLCPQCAIQRFAEGQISETGIEHTEILNTINEMRNILSNIAGHINTTADQKSSIPSNSCHICGCTERDIITTNKIGCSYCIDKFESLIKNRVHQHSFGGKYKGFIPNRFRQEHFKNLELEKLRLKLQALIREEAYEEAAKIKRRISKLETSSS